MWLDEMFYGFFKELEPVTRIFVKSYIWLNGPNEAKIDPKFLIIHTWCQ